MLAVKMRFRTFSPLLLSALVLAACPGKDDSRGASMNPPTTMPPPPAPGRVAADTRSHSASGSSWTLLVYMVADNNLEPFALQDIAEMADVGSSQNLNIIVQIDRAEAYTDDALL